MNSVKSSKTGISSAVSGQSPVYRDFISREKVFRRADYQPEQEFYAAIAAGDIPLTRCLCREPFTGKTGLGILSENPLQNFKYHFVITAAMLSRTCIAHGMEVSCAYDLSDYFIRRADDARSRDELDRIHREMCLEYASHMQQLRRSPFLSGAVLKALDYIDEHLHMKILLKDIADFAGICPEHLSRTFHHEMGCTITAYVCNQRLDTAVNMLLYSEYSIADIASILAFSSQSYFARIFASREKMTPSEYRRRHLRNLS